MLTASVRQLQVRIADLERDSANSSKPPSSDPPSSDPPWDPKAAPVRRAAAKKRKDKKKRRA